MASVQISPIAIGSSPRSTVIGGSDHMTTDLASMNDSNMATGVPNGDTKVASPSTNEAANPSQPDPAASRTDGKEKGGTIKGGTVAVAVAVDMAGNLQGGQAPAMSTGMAPSHAQMNAHLPSHPNAPIANTGYYLGYATQNGAPPSPTPYEAAAIGSFIQQPVHFNAAHTSPFGVPNSNTPLSPPRSTVNTTGMVGVPPASPLFPRVNSGGGLEGGLVAPQQGVVMTPQSPSLPYMSPALGSYGNVRAQTGASSDEASWDNRNQNHNAYPSPQLGAQGMMPYIMPRPGQRAYSFDGESMLPPAALDPQDQAAYSPYTAGHSSPAGAALFTHQQPWNYPAPPDMYNPPGSPLQPRPTVHPQMNMYAQAGANMGGAMRAPMGAPYGHPQQQFYPSSSPGPPIQTTASNKGPDGANLFIFHIPNHFTNVDMYNLFCHYGNLLSVRIMVEKDTGRSRGFGFVSYDNPDSAALAIKELNGYTIGNKRLKVQHKQIRSRDLQDRDEAQEGGFGQAGGEADGSYGRSPTGGPFSSSLPPSGAVSNTPSLWYAPQAEGVKTTTTAVAAAVANTTADATANPHPGNPEDGELAAAGAESMGPPPQASPLANLDALQSALPDVSGSTPE